MSLIADTSGILASLNRKDAAHSSVLRVLEKERGSLIVPDLVLAEVDYMAATHLGAAAQEAFLEDVVGGGWTREPMREADLARGLELVRRFREHRIGLVDAVVVATAERLDVDRVLTLDRKHFRPFRLWNRTPVTILPDAQP